MSWNICQNALYFTISIVYVQILVKIIADSWSTSKTESINMSFVYFWWKQIFRKNHGGYSQTKIFKQSFELKYLDLYISRRSFRRRLRISYYFCWKIWLKKQKLDFYAQPGSYLAVFAFLIKFFNKNNMKSVISVENCVDWYINRDISAQNFVWKFLSVSILHDFFRKFCFHQKYTNDMSIDSVFDVSERLMWNCSQIHLSMNLIFLKNSKKHTSWLCLRMTITYLFT